MVDRITPVTTDEDRAAISDRFSVEDAWPVVCEPFTQWALEDRFSLGRPPFEDVGVQVVPDVVPYELMKLRLLNASHQALCYFGYLAGYRLVHEVAQDQLFANFLLDYMNREATPTLAPVPGIDLDAYKLQLIERFSNAAVRDTVARLCAESSDRIPKWLLPVVRENLAAGRDVTLSAAVVASWARYAEGVDEQGEPIKVVDRLADTLQQIAAQQRDDPLAFVKNRELFGELATESTFTERYLDTLNSLHSNGARATLEALASRSSRV
jgi:mannitol 2-dehydrogenase